MKDPIYVDVLLENGDHKYFALTPLETETWADMALRILLIFVPGEQIKKGNYEIYTMHDFGGCTGTRRCKFFGNELISAIKDTIHIDYVTETSGSLWVSKESKENPLITWTNQE